MEAADRRREIAAALMEDGGPVPAGALAARFGVMSIPTLIYFQDGKITGKAVGVQSRNQVLAALGE